MAQSHSFESIGFSPKLILPTHLSIQQATKSKYADEIPMDTVASPNVVQKILAELLGTYILMFAGGGSALVDREKKITIIGIAMVWGLVLMVVIYTVGHISGAHVNPAVSIALGATRKLPFKLVPVYVLSQLIGAILVCLTLRVLYSDQPDIKPTVTQYSDSLTDLQAVIFEFIIIFILMLTICGVATDDRASKGVAGVAIGATVLFNVLIAGPITGASMNPARSIGPAVISGVYKLLQSSGPWKQHWFTVCSDFAIPINPRTRLKQQPMLYMPIHKQISTRF